MEAIKKLYLLKIKVSMLNYMPYVTVMGLLSKGAEGLGLFMRGTKIMTPEAQETGRAWIRMLTCLARVCLRHRI